VLLGAFHCERIGVGANIAGAVELVHLLEVAWTVGPRKELYIFTQHWAFRHGVCLTLAENHRLRRVSGAHEAWRLWGLILVAVGVIGNFLQVIFPFPWFGSRCFPINHLIGFKAAGRLGRGDFDFRRGCGCCRYGWHGGIPGWVAAYNFSSAFILLGHRFNHFFCHKQKKTTK
jgi:hypothetical protein